MYRMKSVDNNTDQNVNKNESTDDTQHQQQNINKLQGQNNVDNQSQQQQEIAENSELTEDMRKPFKKNSTNANDDSKDKISINGEPVNSRRESRKENSRQSSLEENATEKTLLTSSMEETNSKAPYKRYNSFNRENEDRSSEQQTKEGSGKFKSIATLATLSKWWKKKVDEKISHRKNTEKIEERKMRFKLQYHFMSPFEKYKLGRKPWKLGIQILKIFLVTAQVLLFGADRFASVAFLKNTHKSFKYIFIPDFDGSPSFSIYSREQLVDTIKNVQVKYETLTNVSIGKYWHMSNPPVPVQLCEENVHGNSSDSESITRTMCWNISKRTNYSQILYDRNYFDKIHSIQLRFHLKAVYLNAMILHHRPECLKLSAKVNIDNEKHDGRMRVTLKMDQQIIGNDECNGKYKRKEDANVIQQILIAFDILVITICAMSAYLCLRSVVKSILLAKATETYFKEYRQEKLTKWDLLELINKWFPVIASSDLLSITGSIYKIYVDKRDIRYYNVSSLFLGVGVILVWVGFLRFFTYLKEYNTLLITLRVAAPSLLQFMFCAMFLFTGFTFCGWVVLGAYHEKFTSFLTTAECLFSLVNGDDMYPTFSNMPKMNVPVWVFSKIYIYVFVSLFIYAVLSTFISIVGDAYERLKDYGRMPPTRIECFITGRRQFQEKKSLRRACLRCEPERMGNMRRSARQEDIFPFGLITRKTLSDSQLSLVSASLE